MLFYDDTRHNVTGFIHIRVIGWCEGVMYLTPSGRPTDIGLHLVKACYPCSR